VATGDMNNLLDTKKSISINTAVISNRDHIKASIFIKHKCALTKKHKKNKRLQNLPHQLINRDRHKEKHSHTQWHHLYI